MDSKLGAQSFANLQIFHNRFLRVCNCRRKSRFRHNYFGQTRGRMFYPILLERRRMKSDHRWKTVNQDLPSLFEGPKSYFCEFNWFYQIFRILLVLGGSSFFRLATHLSCHFGILQKCPFWLVNPDLQYTSYKNWLTFTAFILPGDP